MKTMIAAFVVLQLAVIACVYWLGYQYGVHSTPATQGTNAQAITGLSRASILQMLPNQTWYWHWERKNLLRPDHFVVAADDTIDRDDGSKMTLELRWVIKTGSHLLIPTDDYTIQGFFIPTGRQVGFFREKPQQ